MSFERTKTLQDNEAIIRIDVEAMARIEISDVEYILNEIKDTVDPRLRRVLIETAVTKAATAYQLFLRACDYNRDACKGEVDDALKDIGNSLDQLKKQTNENHPKNANSTSLGKAGHAREKMFHDGIGFIQKTLIYPFGKISGRGFVGIRVKLGGKLKIKGVHVFDAKDTEYVITSEGVFEIHQPEKQNEEWKLLKLPLEITATDEPHTFEWLTDSVKLLKELWFQVASKMRDGDGQHPLCFLNEGGQIEILEQDNEGKVTTYRLDEQMRLIVNGDLTIRPPKSIVVEAPSRHSS